MAYRPTPRTEARREAVRERILAATLTQISAGGYGSVAVQGVAARAGLATGTVYRHFPSKAALLSEAFERASRRELAVLASLAAERDRPATERLAACIEAFARRALARPTLAYAQIAEPVDARVDAERLRLRRGYRDLFAGLLEEAVAAREIPPLDAGTAAAATVGAIAEALVGPLAPGAGAGPRRGREALIASITSFCLSAIHAEPGRIRDATVHGAAARHA